MSQLRTGPVNPINDDETLRTRVDFRVRDAVRVEALEPLSNRCSGRSSAAPPAASKSTVSLPRARTVTDQIQATSPTPTLSPPIE